MGDKKLADLFTPCGTVIYAKVGVEKDTGRNRTYGMLPSCLVFFQDFPVFTLNFWCSTNLFALNPKPETFIFESLYDKYFYVMSLFCQLC